MQANLEANRAWVAMAAGLPYRAWQVPRRARPTLTLPLPRANRPVIPPDRVLTSDSVNELQRRENQRLRNPITEFLLPCDQISPNPGGWPASSSEETLGSYTTVSSEFSEPDGDENVPLDADLGDQY